LISSLGRFLNSPFRPCPRQSKSAVADFDHY
jgi:hypothetical protein